MSHKQQFKFKFNADDRESIDGIMDIVGNDYEYMGFLDLSDFNDNINYPDTVLELVIDQPKMATLLSLRFGHLIVK